MQEMEQKEKKKGFFSRLFSKGDKTEERTHSEEDAVDRKLETDGGTQEGNAEAEQVLPPDNIIEVTEGALLQIWEKHFGGAFSLSFNLDGEDDEDSPRFQRPLDYAREKNHLLTLLERDARRYLQEELKLAQEAEPDKKVLCRTYTSTDGLAAWIFLFPLFDKDDKYSMDQLADAMKEGNVTSGLNSSAVTYLIRKQPVFKLIPCAEGTPMVPSRDGSIIEHFARQVEAEIQLDEKGNADYRAQNFIQQVHEGDLICDIVPPEEGVPGMRVDGKAILPKPAKPAKRPNGKNTVLSEDGTQLLAAIDGLLEHNGVAFEVHPLLDVKGDVDYSSGNIDFLGDVHIHGDVREGFSVRATGNVMIDGLVEAAQVQAGGDIVIASGVLGDNRALIKSGGSIRVKYLESCTIYATGGLMTDCIITSQIYSDENIKVTSGRGAIIGGAITAATEVEAKLIGTDSGRKTQISLGVRPCIQEEMRNDADDLNQIRNELADLERKIRVLENKQGMAGSSEPLAKAQLRKSVLLEKEEQIKQRRQDSDENQIDWGNCHLICGHVYPGTNLTIGKAVYNFDTSWKNCRASYDRESGEIYM